jgi:hypothetical protein
MDRLLAVDDDRGRLAGLGAVLLAVFVFLLLTRMDWSAGVDMIVSGVAAAALLGPAWALAPAGGDAPPAGWLSAILVAGFALELGFLISLADVLGANTDDVQSGTIVWITLLLTVVFGMLSLRRNSAVCTLLAAAAAAVGVVAAVDWIFSPETATTFRWVLFGEGLALFAAGAAAQASRGRHGVVLVVLSGVAVLAITVTYFGVVVVFGETDAVENITAWWEIVTLAFGMSLALFAAHTREPGPGYAAAALLFAFATLTNAGVEDKFLGWPLFMLILTGAVIAAFLRGAGPSPGSAAADTTREVRL